ncbi:response regulator transcription factor [Paenibacillus albus]|nr:response regulator [Paenibacillus albus]
MLIVDDERFEREGVKFLIEKYNLPLATYEADSGESALAFMKEHPVDILFSDIRMNGMDGLQLAAQIRELEIPVKVIFMSAYGEFEYAQRAIDLKAIRYILKPVQVDEFLKVLSQVMQLCSEERQMQEKQQLMEEAYRNDALYSKQKLLSNLVLGHSVGGGELQAMPLSSLIGIPRVRLVMLDSRTRFFDLLDQHFEQQLSDVLKRSFELVHLNEFQSLLILEGNDLSREELIVSGERFIRWFHDLYGGDLSVVMGGLAEDSEQLVNEYAAVESMLEYKFYHDEGTVLLAHSAAHGKEEMQAVVDAALTELRQHITQSRYELAKLRFEQLFNDLRSSEQFSVIYVKFICTEIIRAIFEASAKKNADSFKQQLEQIYRTSKLSDLRKVVLSILEEKESPSAGAAGSGAGSGSQDSLRKVIEHIVAIIESEYSSDLSLEALAERVYLSPSYLSHLFKKQLGVSFNKYLTVYRMERTKELLLTTNRKIIDIGLEVGYSNFPYFSSLFKNYYGKTPSQFREEAAR